MINFRQKSSPNMLSMHCKTPEPSPTFDRQELNDISRYQYNVQTPLRNELDKVITQNTKGKYINFIITIFLI